MYIKNVPVAFFFCDRYTVDLLKDTLSELSCAPNGSLKYADLFLLFSESPVQQPFDSHVPRHILHFRREIRWTCFDILVGCSIGTTSASSFFLLSSSCQRVFSRFLWTRLSPYRQSCFPPPGLLRSLAICKPASSTGIEDIRTCYVAVHASVYVRESCIYAWHIIYIHICISGRTELGMKKENHFYRRATGVLWNWLLRDTALAFISMKLLATTVSRLFLFINGATLREEHRRVSGNPWIHTVRNSCGTKYFVG